MDSKALIMSNIYLQQHNPTSKRLKDDRTSNSNLELPKLVLCFCQKLSGLMMRAMWMQQGNDSCRTFSRGLMESHLEPRMSTMTVKPCLHTSSLDGRGKIGEREQNMSFNIFSFALHNLWCILLAKKQKQSLQECNWRN